jgi:hypothetical protein
MSSSEEISFKTCRLGHAFGYRLRYAPIVTNRKLSVGIGLHECLEGHYKGEPWKANFHKWAAERWEELVAGGVSDLAEVKMAFIKDKALVEHLVEGYIEWALVNGIDAGWEVVEVEAKHYIDVGAATLLPMKFDLLLQHIASGKLKLVDFKTAAGFSENPYPAFQVAEQTLNYAMGVYALYGQIPEVEYRQLRKVNRDNANSKPPYFRVVNITVTGDEILQRQADYKRIAEERMDPDAAIYANPSACCGSWKNDWQGPCQLVHQGLDPQEALEMSSKYAPKDPYERYEDTEVPSGG